MPDAKPNAAPTAANSPAGGVTFEVALAKLETIVHELEEGQLGLAESLARYEEGVKLLKQCHGMLDCAQRKIELLSGVDAAGNPIVQPFDDAASLDADPNSAPRTRKRSAPSPARPAPRPIDDAGMDVPGSLF